MDTSKRIACCMPLLAFLISSCGSSGNGNQVSGNIQVDGSSTVYPITEAVAEEFRSEAPEVRVTVGVSGTGGGFKKFCKGETDISDASRTIQEGEIQKCKKKGIDYIQLKVAFDGMAVVAHPENDWLDSITVQELRKIWRPEAQNKIDKWSQVRSNWPDKELNLYGAGTASGTYDYFTKAIVGKSGKSRGDYMASEDDNVLVKGVSGDKYALGFFGLAYFEENQDKLKMVGVDNGSGAVLPSLETVKSGEYKPLSRPLFIYVNKEAAQRKEVKKFVRFYLNNAGKIAKSAGYVAMPEEEYKKQLEKFNTFAGEGADGSKSQAQAKQK